MGRTVPPLPLYKITDKMRGTYQRPLAQRFRPITVFRRGPVLFLGLAVVFLVGERQQLTVEWAGLAQ